MKGESRSAFPKVAAAISCLFLASACGTLRARDPCGLSHLEETGEVLLEEGDFAGLWALYLPCAQKEVPEAEFFLAILILDVESNPLQLEEKERVAEALKWMCRSAIHGFDEAIWEITDSYKWGSYGLPKDPEQEACWRKKGEAPESSIVCECPE